MTGAPGGGRAGSDRPQPEPGGQDDPGVAGGAALNAVAQVGAAVAGAATGIVVARLLGPSGTGAFNVVLAALLLAFALSTLGFPTGLLYRMSSGALAPGYAFRHVLVGAGVVGVVAGLGATGLAATDPGFFRHLPLATVALGMAALPFFVAWMSVANLALGIERYGLAAAAPAAQAVAALVFVAALTPSFGLRGAVIGVLGAHALVAAATAAWALRRLPASGGWWRRTPRVLRDANAFGWKVYATQALSMVNQRLDLFVLNAVATSAAVGHYSIAVAAAMTGTLVPRGLALVVFPRVARLEALAPEVRAITVVKALRHVVLVALMTMVVMAPALLLIPFVYGSQFGASVKLALILLPGIAAFNVLTVMTSIAVGVGRPEFPLYVALIVTPLTVALYLTLIPALDAPGAALASTLSYAASGALAFVFLRRATPLPPLRRLAPTREDVADYGMLLKQLRARIRAWRAPDVEVSS